MEYTDLESLDDTDWVEVGPGEVWRAEVLKAYFKASGRKPPFKLVLKDDKETKHEHEVRSV